MQDLEDNELLREYVTRDSETAFAEIVARHLNKVYSVAWRHTSNPHAAEEITQAVFVILATKARHLSRHVILSGWFYETARLTALTYIRSEIRRTRREEAHMQSVLNESESEVWMQIAPLLDAAMAKLNETDRHAVVLRFFDGKSMKEVAAALGANEDAAKKRVSRALEKLREFFTKRGVVSTATAIAGAISANSVQAAPAALAKTVTAVAIAKGAAASASTLTLIKGALKIMAWTKAKTITAVALAAIMGTSITIVAVKKLLQPKNVAAAYPGDWIWEANSQTLDRVPPIFLLQPSTMPANWVPFDMFGKDRYLTRGKTIKELIARVWSQKNSSLKLIFTADLPDDKYDFIVTSQPHWWDKLELEINKRFNLVEQIEDRDTGEVVIVKKAR